MFPAATVPFLRTTTLGCVAGGAYPGAETLTVCVPIATCGSVNEPSPAVRNVLDEPVELTSAPAIGLPLPSTTLPMIVP